MKALWLVIGIIILIGVIVFLRGGETADVIPEMDDIQDMQTNEDDMDETDNMNDEGEENNQGQHDDMSGDAMSDEGGTESDVSVEAEGEVMVDTGLGDATTETHVIDLNGFNFGYSVEEIRVKEGDTVTINLTSTDGFHDWVVDEFNAATAKVQTGGSTSVTFVADKAGTYEYYCSVGQHRANGMVGTLIVE